jgi:hypothetical protein
VLKLLIDKLNQKISDSGKTQPKETDDPLGHFLKNYDISVGYCA